MAGLAQRLPVAGIPKQLLVALVRDDVVHHRGADDQSALTALLAQRVRSQIGGASLLPASAITALGRAAAPLVIRCAALAQAVWAEARDVRCGATASRRPASARRDFAHPTPQIKNRPGMPAGKPDEDRGDNEKSAARRMPAALVWRLAALFSQLT